MASNRSPGRKLNLKMSEPSKRIGQTEARYQLGLAYANGLGVEKDESKAGLWFWSAAEQNHAQAQFSLGLIYEYGRGMGAPSMG